MLEVLEVGVPILAATLMVMLVDGAETLIPLLPAVMRALRQGVAIPGAPVAAAAPLLGRRARSRSHARIQDCQPQQSCF